MEHKDAPKMDNYVRAKLLFSGIVITPLDENSCRVVYVTSSNPMGSIPAWLVHAAAIKQPLVIANIRSFIKKNETQLKQRVQKLLSQQNSSSSSVNLLQSNGPETRAGEELVRRSVTWSLESEFSEVRAFKRRSTASLACSAISQISKGSSSASGMQIGYACIQILRAKREAKGVKNAAYEELWSSDATLYARVSLDSLTQTTTATAIESVKKNAALKVANFDSVSSKFALPVSDGSSRLRISLCSKFKGSDYLLGDMFVPMADISHQNALQGWFSLIGGEYVEDVDARPIIEVKLCFVFSELLDFAVSCVEPEEVEVQNDQNIQEYAPEKLVSNVYRFVDATRPVTSLSSVLASPSLTGFLIFLAFVCCYYPNALPLLVGISILWFLAVEFVNNKFHKYLSGSSHLVRVDRDRQERVKSVVRYLGEEERNLSPELRRLLRTVQHETGRFAGMLETFSNYCNWSEPLLTQSVAIITVVCMVLSLFLPLHVEAALLISIVLTWNSRPVKALRRLVSRVQAYSQRRRSRKRFL